MLSTVRAKIQQMQKSQQTFNHVYKQYIASVQDFNLHKEMQHLVARNTLSVNAVDKLIHSAFERLGDLNE